MVGFHLQAVTIQGAQSWEQWFARENRPWECYAIDTNQGFLNPVNAAAMTADEKHIPHLGKKVISKQALQDKAITRV